MAERIGLLISHGLGKMGDRYENQCWNCADAGYVIVKRLAVFGGAVSQRQETERCEHCNPERPLGIPPSRKNDRFQNFNDSLASAAYNRAYDVATGDEWCAVLIGTPGNGKTHLAIAALNEFGKGQFWKVPDLLDAIRRRSYDGGEGADVVLAEYREMKGLLVLDDLGAQKQTDWVTEILYRILDYRCDEKLPTIITSNTPFADLDPRIQSRYRKGLVICKGADVR